MNTALLNSALRAKRSATVAVIATTLTLSVLALALFVSSASAINVKLRIEGAATTHFNGVVNTGPRSVHGGVDSPNCRANATASNFTEANGLTAAADALGANITTSGTHYGWGTLLCTVNGEETPSQVAGWLVRINNKNSTAPGGFVTATTTVAEGDSVLFYMSPDEKAFGSSLDVMSPANAAPGQPISVLVDEYEHVGDTRSAASGVSVQANGTSATTAADGSATVSFPSSGRFLITATKPGAVRGSAFITIDPATPASRIMRVNRFVKCNRVYRKKTKKHKRCIRIVRAKQRAAKKR